MDGNKLKKLSSINYQLRNCCGRCKYGNFPNNDFGTCSVHTYEHLKHSEKERELSIHKYGICENSFESKEDSQGAVYFSYL